MGLMIFFLIEMIKNVYVCCNQTIRLPSNSLYQSSILEQLIHHDLMHAEYCTRARSYRETIEKRRDNDFFRTVRAKCSRRKPSS